VSVRQRLERQAFDAEDVVVRPTVNKAMEQAGAVSSVRSREEHRAFVEASEEPRPRNTGHLADGMGYATGINTSVRSRAAVKQFEAEEKANPAVSTLSEFYLAEHNRREAEKKAARDAEIASGKLIIL
jgi:hypothetical protein